MNEKMLEYLQEGIILFDENYKIQFCNKKVLEKLNYQKRELEKESLSLVVCHQMEAIRKACETQTDSVLNLSLCDKEKKEVEVEARVFEEVCENGVQYYLILTTYKETSQEKERREALELMMQHLPFAIWMVDENEKSQYANMHAKDLLHSIKNIKGVERPEGFGEATTEQVFGTILEKETIGSDRERLKRGEIIDEERTTNKASNRLNYHLIKVPIFGEGGNYKGYIAMNQYHICSQELQQLYEIESTGCKKLDEKIMVNEVISCLKLQAVAIDIMKSNSMLVLKYNRKKDRLEGLCRFFRKSGQGTDDVKHISLSRDGFEALVKQKTEWRAEEVVEKLEGHIEGKEQWGDYINLVPIRYNGEFLGGMIVDYEKQLEYPLLEWALVRKHAYYIGMVLKNMQTSLAMKRELVARKEVASKLRTHLSIAADFMIMLDKKGRIISWTKKEVAAMGWSKDQIVPSFYEEWIYPGEREVTQEAIAEIKRTGQVVEFTSHFKHQDGSYRWILWRGKFNKEDEKIYFMARDMTKECETREALKLETLKTEFLANISHELKTPLNIIYSMLQMTELELSHLPEVVKEIMDVDSLRRYGRLSKQNVRRLLKLIENITDISKIGAGYYEAQLVNGDMVRIVENITTSVVEYVKNKGRHIIFDTQVEELVMACDPEKMERIMLNLLSNSVKYTHPGDEIEVNLEVNGKELVILVRDTGVGIPEDKRDSIFGRFVQVDNAFARKCEGTGIGLALVKSLVEMQKGSVSVESELGKGTTFMIKLPIYHVEKTYALDYEREDLLSQKCKIEFSDIYEG